MEKRKRKITKKELRVMRSTDAGYDLNKLLDAVDFPMFDTLEPVIEDDKITSDLGSFKVTEDSGSES